MSEHPHTPRTTAGSLVVPALLAVAWATPVFSVVTPPLARIPAAADTVRVRDDHGRVLRLASSPERIVSLLPAATEILFALGAGDRLVGRTRYGVHPPAAEEVPSVGEGLRPSAEMVLQREPEVVVLYAGAEARATAGELRRLGMETLALEHDTFSDLYRNIRRLGHLVSRDERARRLVRRIRCELQSVTRITERRPTLRVYYEVWGDPPITVGAGSYLDSLIAVAGGENVFGNLLGPSPRVSVEAVASRDPDVILVPEGSGGGGRVPPSDRSGWEVVPAVREGAVRRVDGELLHRLGPRSGEAARALGRAIHPELAGELRSPPVGCRGRPDSASGTRPRRER